MSLDAAAFGEVALLCPWAQRRPVWERIACLRTFFTPPRKIYLKLHLLKIIPSRICFSLSGRGHKLVFM